MAAALLADRPEPAWPEIEAAVGSAGAGPLYLTGGEPTLRRDLLGILGKLRQAFPERDLVLVTNGRSFFYEKMCDALAAAATERLAVEVVIASTRRDVHDALVDVAESFDQASKGIQHLVAHGQHTRVRVLVGRHNIDHLHEIAAWIPDRFAGIERVVWDIATLAERRGDLGLRPDEIASYLESALNLLRSRSMPATVLGMPACAITESYRDHLDRSIVGVFRDECAPCDARTTCCGLLGSLADDPAFRIHPVVSTSDTEVAVEYERYLMELLARYVPDGARDADLVLDAMCGPRLRNLPVLRQFFRAARSVDATDIDLDEETVSPAGTTVFRADACQPLLRPERYACIALFKPPEDAPGRPMQQALANLVTALQPGGYFLIVLAEHTDIEPVLDALSRLDVAVLTSEPNALRRSVEPEHKWVIVCQAKATQRSPG